MTWEAVLSRSYLNGNTTFSRTSKELGLQEEYVAVLARSWKKTPHGSASRPKHVGMGQFDQPPKIDHLVQTNPDLDLTHAYDCPSSCITEGCTEFAYHDGPSNENKLLQGLLLRKVPLGSQCSSCLELLAGVYHEIWIGINI